jgi:nitrate reductase molybdenum cofactor assembly chaperone
MRGPGALPSFATLLDYPGPGMIEALDCLRCGLSSGQLEAFGEFLRTTSLCRLEEQYTALFDLQPELSLHLGHQLFGEDRRRGVFMAGLAAHYRRRDFCYPGELPDHLPVLLRYLAVAAPQPEDDDLVDLVLVPALQKIVCKLPDQNPWRSLLVALVEVVQRQGASSKKGV